MTVINSGVIVADVLLPCDGPSAPSPSSSRADVIMSFGTTPASSTVVLCLFFFFFFTLASSSAINARLPQWPWLGNTGHGVS